MTPTAFMWLYLAKFSFPEAQNMWRQIKYIRNLANSFEC
jgi:hypothetical protein